MKKQFEIEQHRKFEEEKECGTLYTLQETPTFKQISQKRFFGDKEYSNSSCEERNDEVNKIQRISTVEKGHYYKLESHTMVDRCQSSVKDERKVESYKNSNFDVEHFTDEKSNTEVVGINKIHVREDAMMEPECVTRKQTNEMKGFANLPFERLVREIGKDVQRASSKYKEGDKPYRFNSHAMFLLKSCTEIFTVNLIEESYVSSLRAKRVTLMARDFRFARRIRGHKTDAYT
jgi:histone H3/H4